MGLKEVIDVKRNIVLNCRYIATFIATHFFHNVLLLHDELIVKFFQRNKMLYMMVMDCQ